MRGRCLPKQLPEFRPHELMMFGASGLGVEASEMTNDQGLYDRTPGAKEANRLPHGRGEDFGRRRGALVHEYREGQTISFRPLLEGRPRLHRSGLPDDENYILSRPCASSNTRKGRF